VSVVASFFRASAKVSANTLRLDRGCLVVRGPNLALIVRRRSLRLIVCRRCLSFVLCRRGLACGRGRRLANHVDRPLTVSIVVVRVKTVTGLADDFFSACALRAAAATLPERGSAVNKLGREHQRAYNVANRMRFGFMVIRRLFWRERGNFNSGGSQSPTRIARQSSAASGKPAAMATARGAAPDSPLV